MLKKQGVSFVLSNLKESFARAMFRTKLDQSILRQRTLLLDLKLELHPHTQVRYTRKWCHVVLCVNGENATSKLLHFWSKRVDFRSYVDHFCIWVQNVARKVATVAGFAVMEHIS